MKLSNLLFNSLKEPPKEAKIISHQLMLRSSMIRQHTSGNYTWLPLGFKVLKNIENIIRNNQDEIKDILLNKILFIKEEIDENSLSGLVEEVSRKTYNRNFSLKPELLIHISLI